MSKEQRFELWVERFRSELAEEQIEVIQNSLSNFEWLNEYKQILQDRIKELRKNKDE